MSSYTGINIRGKRDSRVVRQGSLHRHRRRRHRRLAAAAFLQRACLPAVIYEQAIQLTEVGAGLVLAPNAVRLLRQLGIMRQLREHAVPLDVGWEFRRWEDGRILSAEDLAGSCEQIATGSGADQGGQTI